MEPFIAEIILFGGNFAPRGWAFCDGQLLPISQNTALFSILGTTYGGDGITTFALPDLRGRAPIHAGQGPGLSNYSLGQAGGTENVTLTKDQIPAHSHAIGAVSSPGNNVDPTNGLIANTGSVDSYSDSSFNAQMNSTMVANTGGSQSHTNIQPYLALNYIIALVGVFPSRS